jgi:hypothetical protein
MNSYELFGPGGGGSGIWSCGECHKSHLIATRAGKPVTDMNRRAAEECCAPRNCHYCGLVTERDSTGQFRWEHEACVPKYEPVPPHPSMANPYARLLYQKMSGVSQDAWCAGWMSGNEYALWDVLHGNRHEYGWGNVPYEDLEELRLLSEHAGGWIWTGPEKEYTPQLVTFAEWESIRATRKVPEVDSLFAMEPAGEKE